MVKKNSGKNKTEEKTMNEAEEIKNTSENQENTETELKDTESPDLKSEQENGESAVNQSDILIAKLAEMQDRYLRLSAEFDNYRKRTLKERGDLIKTAGEGIILKIIPVMDDFERAIGFINTEGEVDESKKGIVLIYKKMKEILSAQGVKEIDALHKEFDSDIHEAVTKIPAPEKKLKGKVVDVVEKGYMMGEKIVRYSKVVVGE
jgi:molecular chaperone GrpE